MDWSGRCGNCTERKQWKRERGFTKLPTGVEITQMTKLLLTSIAALFLATGTALSTPLTDREKQTVYRGVLEPCVRDWIKRAPSVPQYLPRPAFTIEEIWDFCRCSAEMSADLMTSEEYAARSPLSESTKQSVREKTECIVIEKCKQHLNLPNASRYSFERCWKG